MKYRSALLVLPILLLTAHLDGHAQTESRSASLYRCGKDGRDLRDAPCPDKPHAPPAEIRYDAPSAGDARAARELAAADAQQARSLQQDRLKQEAEQQRLSARAGRLSPAAAPAPKPASAPQAFSTHKPKLKRPHKPRATAG